MRDFRTISHFLHPIVFLYLFPFNKIRPYLCLKKRLCNSIKLINSHHFVLAKEHLCPVYILNKYFYSFTCFSFTYVLYLFL